MKKKGSTPVSFPCILMMLFIIIMWCQYIHYMGHIEFKNTGTQSVLQSWLFESLILINDNRSKACKLPLYVQINMVMYSFSPLARPTIANDNNDITVKIKSGVLSTEFNLFK